MSFSINDIVVLKNSNIKFKVTAVKGLNQLEADILNSEVKDNWTLNFEDIEIYESANKKLLNLGYILTVDGPRFRTYQNKDILDNAIFIDKKQKTLTADFHYNLELSKVLTQLLTEI